MPMKDQQPWETRSGDKLDHLGPQSGEDLAAMQRKQNTPRRDRAQVAQARQSEQQARLSRMEESAKKARLKELISNKWVLISAAVVVLALVLVYVVSTLSNQPASQEDFQNTLPRIELQAVQDLQVDSKPRISEDSQTWKVSYTVKPGSLAVDARRTTGSCGAVYVVRKDQPRQDVLAWSTLAFKKCRFK